MRIAFITGGNTGLGFETARRLIAAGYRVYIGCRDAAKGEAAAAQLGARSILLDVTCDASAQRAAEAYQQAETRLDILINNAGIPGGHVAPEAITADMMRRVYDTNVFGIVRVTHAFLPLLQQSDHPVIVNVSSGMGSFGRVLDPRAIESTVVSPVYSSSKAAVCMLTVQYAKGLPAIQINAVDPGPTQTGERFSRGAQTVQEGTDAIVRMATIGRDGPTGTFVSRDGAMPW